MATTKIATALNNLHYPDVKKLQEAFKTLYRLMKDTTRNEFSSPMTLDGNLEYNKYEVSRVVGFNTEMARVFFADRRIGRVFHDLDAVLEFFEQHPGAKKYCGLLFQHDSVCNLVNSNNILSFVRRMPLTATTIIAKNDRLLHCIDSFDLLVQIISLVPIASSTFIFHRWKLIEKEAQLTYIGELAPNVMDTLLTEEMLGGMVKDEARRALMLQSADRYEYPTDKLVVSQLQDKDPGIVVQTLRGEKFHECADLLKGIYGTEKIDDRILNQIRRRLIHVLNIGLEKNDINAVLDLAHIHLGFTPLFEYRDEQHYRQAEYYIQLAQRLLGQLNPKDQTPHLQRMKELDLQLKKQSRQYFQAHPSEIVKYSLKQLKRMNNVEQANFERHCRTLEHSPELVIEELANTRNYETLIRFALNSDDMAKMCAHPKMAAYWNDILLNLYLTPDPRSVLGYSFSDVMGTWLYSHYEKWSLAGEGGTSQASELLERSIDFGSAMGLYKKHAHLLSKLKENELSPEEKQELLGIADQLSSKYWTFGFVLAGIIYLYFATFCSKDTTESHNYMVRVLACLNCGEHFEQHGESKRLNQNLGTTPKELQENFGIEFKSWDKQRASVKVKMLLNMKRLMGIDSSNAKRSTLFDCSHSVTLFQGKAHKNDDVVNNPFLNLDVLDGKKAEAYCIEIEKNWEAMCQRAQDVQETLKFKKTTGFHSPVTEEKQRKLWDSAVKSVDNEWSFKILPRLSFTPSRRVSFTPEEQTTKDSSLKLWGAPN